MRSPALLLLLCFVLVLAGCTGPLDPDPLNRPGSWVMNASPLENTAEQVADKSDLLQGKSDPTSIGVAAAAGVDLAIGGAAGTAAGLQKAPVTITFSSGTGS